jgi:hypothetical protein
MAAMLLGAAGGRLAVRALFDATAKKPSVGVEHTTAFPRMILPPGVSVTEGSANPPSTTPPMSSTSRAARVS